MGKGKKINVEEALGEKQYEREKKVWDSGHG